MMNTVETTKEQQEILNRIFMALADATRRQLVHMLSQRPHTMSELVEPFDMSFAAISKHVKVLEQAGLITRDIKGRTHHISLQTSPLMQALDWISIYRRFWQDKLDNLEELLTEG